MQITKELLDNYYSHTFDIERFKAGDPCGTVYELMKHTDNQLDIEIGALLVAMISWGSRKVIIPTALHMLRDEMHWHPASFIMNKEYLHAYTSAKNGCVYRTLNVDTFRQVCDSLRQALNGHPTMESLFDDMPTKDVISTICQWLTPARVGTMDKSACKRVCMFLRWMVRSGSPVDLGLWSDFIDRKTLIIPLDTHVVRQSRRLGLLASSCASMCAARRLSASLAEVFPDDPLRGDFALFGYGVAHGRLHGES